MLQPLINSAKERLLEFPYANYANYDDFGILYILREQRAVHAGIEERLPSGEERSGREDERPRNRFHDCEIPNHRSGMRERSQLYRVSFPGAMLPRSRCLFCKSRCADNRKTLMEKSRHTAFRRAEPDQFRPKVGLSQ